MTHALLPCPPNGAVLDGDYRYALRRTWNESLPIVTWLLLNPSTADALTDDQTLRRLRGFSAAWGAGGLLVVNLFALRSKDPRTLRTAPDPVGPLNDAWLADAAAHATTLVLGWGTSAGLEGGARARDVLELLARHAPPGVGLDCLARTTHGWPKHPLYVRQDTVRALYLPRTDKV